MTRGYMQLQLLRLSARALLLQSSDAVKIAVGKQTSLTSFTAWRMQQRFNNARIAAHIYIYIYVYIPNILIQQVLLRVEQTGTLVNIRRIRMLE